MGKTKALCLFYLSSNRPFYDLSRMLRGVYVTDLSAIKDLFTETRSDDDAVRTY